MDTVLTDDHVAELLAQEAKDHSLRYSAMGLEAYRSSPRPAAKAKPNTRFLRNIISQTKNHNEALLAKEAAEAQARLDSLAEAKAREERKRRPGAQDLRRRQLGEIAATLQGRKRTTREGEQSSDRKHGVGGSSRRERSAEKTERGLGAEQKGHGGRSRDREHDRERRRHRRQDGSQSPARHGETTATGSSRRDRSRSPDDTDRKRRHSRHYRARSPLNVSDAVHARLTSHRRHQLDRHRDREHEKHDTHASASRSHRHRHRNGEKQEDKQDEKQADEQDEKQDEKQAEKQADKRGHKRSDRQRDRQRDRHGDKHDDSDPLEDLIGPVPSSPKIRRKGRGAASGPSAMDTRFSASYDPKSDIQPDSDLEGDDWGDSLEALRDRARWRQQGAERLRAAGFTDEQIAGWERSGGREKGVEDVRWATSGEGREWDRGKIDSGLDQTEGRLGWDRE